MITVTDGTQGVPVAWQSWTTWRVGRCIPELVMFRSRSLTNWCPTCTGKGWLFAPARNGEGLVPSEHCPSCMGTGSASGRGNTGC